MSRVLVLGHDDARAALDPDALLAAVRTALVSTARGEASTPPRIAAFGPAGLLGAMPGYVPGLGMAGKLVTVFAVPGAPGRSSHRGVVALFDEHDGHLLALIDAEAVTAARTAASATVAFRGLVPGPVARIAVIGAGAQARAQLELLAHLGTDAEVVVASRDPDSAAAAARDAAVTAAATPEEAVAGAEVVFCCTDAAEPVVRLGWLAPGAHVSSVGGSRGPELDAATIAAAAVFVEWLGAVERPPPAGAHELQGLPRDRVRMVGDVLGGVTTRTRGELTVFKSTGFAGLDVAAASVALASARREGLGSTVHL